jgi:hypothetical protein
MSPSVRLKRLIAIRRMEEQHATLQLQSAESTLQQFRRAQDLANARSSMGRELVRRAARTAELEDRLSGIAESITAERVWLDVTQRISVLEKTTERIRCDVLERNRNKRQAETLFENAVKRQALESTRRFQNGLDEWHRHRSSPTTLRLQCESAPSQIPYQKNELQSEAPPRSSHFLISF